MEFSIIIPVYNVADYLRKCLDSVLANDLTGCEVILVAAGSPDGISSGSCAEYAAKHPQTVRDIHQENRGLGGARNTGLEAAQGEYLFFVDSDDFLPPQALPVLKEAVSRTHADIYSFYATSTDGEGHEALVKTSPAYDSVFRLSERPEFLLALPAAWARIWRRRLFLDSGVRYPSRVWYEVIRTSAKLIALADSIQVLPQPLYCYLSRPGSIMRSGNLDRNREILTAFDDLGEWFTAQGLWQTYYDQLCRLAIDHILLAGSVRVARIDPESELLGEFSRYMENHFPDYRNNPYCSQLPAQHKLLLFLLRRRQYRLIRALFRWKDR